MKSVRLKVCKAVVKPMITTFGRLRVWSKKEVGQMQRVANYAVRWAMGMDILIMKEHHATDRMMNKALTWIGHVVRMAMHRTIFCFLRGGLDAKEDHMGVSHCSQDGHRKLCSRQTLR